MSDLCFVVVTVSDTCHADASKDRSGPALAQLIKQCYENVQIITSIVPDECERIRCELRQFILQQQPPVNVIITTGGTGFAPRDVTPEACKPLIDRECPQLTMAIALTSLQKTPFAALSRGICGIAQQTLILNFPGSVKAVEECFQVVCDILPHALHLMRDECTLIKRALKADNTHNLLAQQLHSKSNYNNSTTTPSTRHICPHKTGAANNLDRNSSWEMIAVQRALQIIFETVQSSTALLDLYKSSVATVNIPPFRASIKDGYAMKSSGFAGSKKVLGYIAAGDEPCMQPLEEDECFKINTGAAVPFYADCVIQVENTKLLKSKKNGQEDLVEILVQPTANLDIRPIGSDLCQGEPLFSLVDHSAVVIKSILASVGQTVKLRKPSIAIVSTGSELQAANEIALPGKIYDSNTTMLEELLLYFGFECGEKVVLGDNFETVKTNLQQLFEIHDFVICSGGVSMGDKDYIKPVLEQLNFEIKFGRVNMKPGKPMTFAARKSKYFFGLPGNPVSAFVTFHLFALPAIRWASGWERNKCTLPRLRVTLENDCISLDPRPEYVRATISNRNGELYASVNGNQISSRLQSIVGADALVLLPGRTNEKPNALAFEKFDAFILRYDFITNYV